jgi:hypothetical protein
MFSFKYKYILQYFLTIVFFTVVAPFAFSQSGKPAGIEKSYLDFSQNNLQEKIYLHTSSQSFLCGEVFWFKAYLSNAVNHQPLSVSKVVYVEVLDQLNQPVLQAKISMKEGMGNGSFYLPFTLASGNYLVRAYTNWMKNFLPGSYFEKNITIINTSKKTDLVVSRAKKNYTAGFFPEGGNLVTGLQSLVAFKVVDDKNKGAQCEGVIVDQFNDTVTHFKSHQFGIGHFMLKPLEGKNYTAIINLANGEIIRKNLPKAFESGFVMHLDNADLNNLKISIETKSFKENISTDVYAIIQNYGRISFAKLVYLENGNANFLISKDSLRDGISQITIFNSNKQPVCERLYFKHPKNKMVITAKADNKNYALRSKVSVGVSAASETGVPLEGNLSAAVYRMDNLDSSGQENIFNYLWLSSGLQGIVENPGYYFTNENAETYAAIDELMLTQGWRKFDWENVLVNTKPSFGYIPEYGGHIIVGRVLNEKSKKPVAGVKVYLSIAGKRIQLHGCVSDSAGLVHFEMKDFFGSNQIVMQTNTGKEKLYQFEIFNPYSEKFSGTLLPMFNFEEKNIKDLELGHISVGVQNAYHQNQLQQLSEPVVDSLPFYFKPYKTYYLDNYKRFTTMEEVMREYVAEVNVRRNGSNYRYVTFNAPGVKLSDVQAAQILFENNPLVLLDGVPVFDINKIIAYDPLKVNKLEVVAERYLLGSVTSDGVLSYTTYKGNLEGFSLDPNDLVLDYEGLQQQRVFYSPQYSTEDEKLSRLPDFRNLLYWAPELKPNSEGKTSFSFFTGDVPGKYLVSIQGLATSGYAGSQSFIITVGK